MFQMVERARRAVPLTSNRILHVYQETWILRRASYFFCSIISDLILSLSALSLMKPSASFWL